MQPLRCKDEKSFTFLQRATNLLEEWKSSKRSGLTSETFLSCTQTMKAVPLLAEHLLERHNFQYVLTGKFMSDPLEARFGWYRQLNGGNFFMSIRQLLHAEKKIRVLSIVQQQLILEASNISDGNSADVFSESLSPVSQAVCAELSEQLRNVSMDDFSVSDANVSFFVAGYIGRSISRRRRCSACKELLVLNDEENVAPPDFVGNSNTLFHLANRGGLCIPSEFCFALTSFAVQNYNFLSFDVTLKEKLLTTCNPRQVFIYALKSIASSSDIYTSLVSKTCASGHFCFDNVLASAFNCFAKNELKRMNTEKENEVTARKIRKLTQ